MTDIFYVKLSGKNTGLVIRTDNGRKQTFTSLAEMIHIMEDAVEKIQYAEWESS